VHNPYTAKMSFFTHICPLNVTFEYKSINFYRAMLC